MNKEDAEKLAQTMSESCLAVRVRLLSRVVTALYDGELRALGLKANQCTMLVCLARLGQADQTKIGRALKMERSTVCRGVERLMARGLVESSATDSRLLNLTQAGREMLGQVHVRWLRAQRKAHRMLGETGTAQLMALALRARSV